MTNQLELQNIKIKINTIKELAQFSTMIGNVIDEYSDNLEELIKLYDDLNKEINIQDVLSMNIVDFASGLNMWNFIHKYDFINKDTYFTKIMEKLDVSHSAFLDMFTKNSYQTMTMNVYDIMIENIKNRIKTDIGNIGYVVKSMNLIFPTLVNNVQPPSAISYNFLFDIEYNGVLLSLLCKFYCIETNQVPNPYKIGLCINCTEQNFTWTTGTSKVDDVNKTWLDHIYDDFYVGNGKLSFHEKPQVLHVCSKNNHVRSVNDHETDNNIVNIFGKNIDKTNKEEHQWIKDQIKKICLDVVGIYKSYIAELVYTNVLKSIKNNNV